MQNWGPFILKELLFFGAYLKVVLLLSNLFSTLLPGIIRFVTKLKSLGLASDNLVDEDDDDDLQNLVDDVDADLESLADDDDGEFIEDEDLELLDQSDVDFENLFPQIMLLWDFSLTFLDNKR